jgi:hypothetical protein
MKKAKQYARKLPVIYGTLTLLLLVLVFSFRRPGSPNNGNAPLGSGSPGPGNQPIASEVNVQQLAAPTSLGNVLLTAVFDEKTASRFMADGTLTIQLEGGRVMLNDRGIDGDEKAGDFVFSVILNDDATTVTNDLSSFNATLTSVDAVAVTSQQVALQLLQRPAA